MKAGKTCVLLKILMPVVALGWIGAAPAEATIVWDWSAFVPPVKKGEDPLPATETGTFTTDGDATGEVIAGTYTVLDFSVTTSSILPSYAGFSVLGDQITLGNPQIGFLWDGSSITRFFRDSGLNTNGFNLLGNSPDGSYSIPRWIFDIGYCDYDPLV